MRPAPALDVGPLADVMTTLIVLLMALGVAAEVEAIPVHHQVSDCVGPPPPRPIVPLPPLTVHLRADGAWVGRAHGSGAPLPRSERAVGRAAIESRIATDRSRHPSERRVVIVTDDGVRYGDLVTALDLSRAYGYDQTLLGVGPPQEP
jgi:biopolymer transport protein ExbD